MTEKMTKEELREDPVLSGLMQAKNFVQQRATWIAIAIGALLVAVIAIQVLRGSQGKAEQQAAVLLIDGESQSMNGNPAEALRKFKEASDRYGRTPSGRIAVVRAADSQMEMGNLEDAKRLYEKFLASGSSDGLLRSSALRGLAGVLDSQGQHEEAAKRFLEAAGIDASPLRPDDLVSAGNAFVDAGKYDRALETFRQVIEKYPEHARVRDAREGIEIAKARSAS